jgi:hypothetical protein
MARRSGDVGRHACRHAGAASRLGVQGAPAGSAARRRAAASRRAARGGGRARRAAEQRLKRRLGIAPGERASSPLGVVLAIHDQADFVLGAWPLLAPVWRMSARELGEAFAVVAGVHLAVNLAGWLLGARTSPL